MSFPKAVRIKDEAVLVLVRRQRCLACPTGGQHLQTEPDHITTRGAGGGDTLDNLWPLCVLHHRTRHMKGLRFMVENFPACAKWLVDHDRMDILDACDALEV